LLDDQRIILEQTQLYYVMIHVRLAGNQILAAVELECCPSDTSALEMKNRCADIGSKLKSGVKCEKDYKLPTGGTVDLALLYTDSEGQTTGEFICFVNQGQDLKEMERCMLDAICHLNDERWPRFNDPYYIGVIFVVNGNWVSFPVPSDYWIEYDSVDRAKK
jgi:hypothetical protein